MISLKAPQRAYVVIVLFFLLLPLLVFLFLLVSTHESFHSRLALHRTVELGESELSQRQQQFNATAANTADSIPGDMQLG